MLTIFTAQKAVVKRMKESGKVFTGNLSFFNEWELFWSSGMSWFHLESDFALTKWK